MWILIDLDGSRLVGFYGNYIEAKEGAKALKCWEIYLRAESYDGK